MHRRSASILRPVVAMLAATMLAVALACASEDPTEVPTTAPATEAPTATPTVPSAEMVLPTNTPVSDTEMDLTWIQRYLKSPGYDPCLG